MSPGYAELGVGLQNFGQFAANNPVMAALSPVTSVVTGLAGLAGNAMMGSQVSPVAAPVAPTETAIAPDPAFSGLAAMNAQQAAQQAAAVEAAAIEAAAVEAAANAANAVAASSTGQAAAGISGAGGSAMGDSGAGIGDVGGGGGFGGQGGDDGMGFGGQDGGGGGSGASTGGSGDDGMGFGGFGGGGYVMNYEQGGLIPTKKYAYGGMTMAPQSYGRMGDSMLVHMNPREVAGLQSLARSQGTSLTVNPQTGYPEAFNLRALLPIIAGFALGPAGAGLTAAQAGMATAALGTAATGSLKKGIMAGIGAYGGAGLGEGLVGPASATPPAPGMEGAIGGGMTPKLSPIDFSVQPPLADVPANLELTGNPYAVSTGKISPFGLKAPIDAPTGLDTTGLAGTTTTAPFPPASDLYSMSAAPGGAGLKVPSSAATTAKTAGLSTTPTSGKFIGNLSGKDAFKYGTAALASIPPPEYEPPKSTAMLRPYDYSFNPVTGAFDPRPGDSSEILYGRPTFTPGEVVPARSGGMMNAAGGLAAFKEGGRPKARPLIDDKGLAGTPYYEFMGERGSNLEAAEKNFAVGGRTPANGKFLMGDGDGMSDDIPGVIADRQPARLADGEFVIPADVVSHIGNGSSKAGAKKLYEMMDKIRKERTGKTKQAPEIKPERHMPA